MKADGGLTATRVPRRCSLHGRGRTGPEQNANPYGRGRLPDDRGCTDPGDPDARRPAAWRGARSPGRSHIAVTRRPRSLRAGGLQAVFTPDRGGTGHDDGLGLGAIAFLLDPEPVPARLVLGSRPPGSVRSPRHPGTGYPKAPRPPSGNRFLSLPASAWPSQSPPHHSRSGVPPASAIGSRRRGNGDRPASVQTAPPVRRRPAQAAPPTTRHMPRAMRLRRTTLRVDASGRRRCRRPAA